MANECNDQVQNPKVAEGKTSFGSPLSDHGYASGVFKACRSNNDSAMLQNHGFPKGDFWNGFKKWDMGGDKDSAPFHNDGRDQARQEVTKNMPQDQQKRVQEQEKAYEHQLKAYRDNLIYGTSMTKVDYPSLDSPEYKDLKAREDAVRKKTESK